MHFTPPGEELAEAFNITWDPDAWGMEEDTHIYASFPSWQNPGISVFLRPLASFPPTPA